MLKANNFTIKDTLQWLPPQSNSLIPNQPIKYLEFKGAILIDTKQNLPAYHKVIKLEKINEQINTVSLNQIKYVALNDSELTALGKGKNFIKNDFNISYSTSYSKKWPYGVITLIPFRKHNGVIEKLVSFSLNIQTTSANNPTINRANDKFISNSVLASGKWYKIGIVKDGVYKLTYNFLQSMGIDVDQIDPRDIKLYGNGGIQLPEDNSAPRIDDLAQNDIYVKGQSDGVFNKNDYLLFYGKGPVKKSINMSSGLLSHQLNQYSDTAYYYITISSGAGKRINKRASSSMTPTMQVNTFNAFQYYEKERVNLIKSGATWLGETFDALLTYDFKFDFPNIVSSEPVTVKSAVAARSTNGSSFKINANGHKQTIAIVGLISTSPGATYAIANSDDLTFYSSNPIINVSISYNKPQNIAKGWLDYIEVNATRELKYEKGQMKFLNISSAGLGNISKFELSNVSSKIKIWDISNFINPVEQDYNLSGKDLSFVVQTDTVKKFIAFEKGDSSNIFFNGKVPNQNLHAITQADMIIVSHPKFVTNAKKIADFHTNEDGLNVVTVTTQQLYNEFSSGLPDPVGIRDFLRMLYEEATSSNDLPKYLLIVGGGSYDYKDIIKNNTNYVPTYEGKKSPFSPNITYNTDDFYGLLDKTESNFLSGSPMIDLGIGRLPVDNNTQLEAIVNKIKNYNTPTTMRDWRNRVVFVADDGDNGLGTGAMSNSDALANIMRNRTPEYMANKIYLDAYKQYTTPGGKRYPDVTKAINNNIEQGSLLINFIGHGGEVGWTHERVLQLKDINNWTNTNSLALFLTATCDFSRFDDPNVVSAGEYVLFNPSGGGIGLLTTTRPVYLSTNQVLNTSFFKKAFTKWYKKPTLGNILMNIKRGLTGGVYTNGLKFVLLGDPALKLAYPKYDIKLTSINNNTPSIKDTLKALSKVTIEGYVADTLGNQLSNFNGIIYPTVYGKTSTIKTLNNDGAGVYSFPLRRTQIFRGKASVQSGKFKYSFIVPKDIAYNYGKGKFSHYAQNEKVDANGAFEDFIIGGTDTSHAKDNTGPEVKLYMNNTNFVNGGVTDRNPLFLAFVSDENGINMTGNGVGHNITAIIDKNSKEPIILNDFYEADLDSYQSGKVDYPLQNLKEGKHTITLKVWDVYNNSATGTIDFYVVDNKEIVLKHVLNYPNPFTSRTEFMFETNQAGSRLNIQIQIFTVSGTLVNTIYKNSYSDGFRIHDIFWDGRDEFGDKLARGVYIYKLKVTAVNGSSAQKIEKLVLL